MINKVYADVGPIEDRLIEELGELIQIISKSRRFGLFNHWNGKTNMTMIREEIADVEERLIEYKNYLDIMNRQSHEQ